MYFDILVCISPEDIKFYRSLVQERRGIVFSFLSTSIDLIENGLIGAEPIPVYLNKRKRRSQNKDEFYFDIDDTIENMEVAVMSDAASDKIDLFNNGRSAFLHLSPCVCQNLAIAIIESLHLLHLELTPSSLPEFAYHFILVLSRFYQSICKYAIVNTLKHIIKVSDNTLLV